MQIKPVAEAELSSILSTLRMPRGELVGLLRQAQTQVFHVECADEREANAKYASISCTRNRSELRGTVALIKRGNSIYLGPYASLGLVAPAEPPSTAPKTKDRGRKGAGGK